MPRCALAPLQVLLVLAVVSGVSGEASIMPLFSTNFTTLFQLVDICDPAGVAAWGRSPVDNKERSAGWCGEAFDDLVRCRKATPNYLLHTFTDRVLTGSTGFAGVGTPEVGDDCISNTSRTHVVERYRSEDPSASSTPAHVRQPLKFQPQWAIENNKACVEELLSLDNPPKHVFADIREFVDKRYRKAASKHITNTKNK